MSKILILEDEFSIRSFIKLKLKGLGYDVIDFERGNDAIESCTEDVDIALLDVMLPDMEGYEVCTKLKEMFPDMGIIMITARGREKDIVKGLRSGSDDYIVKPFGIDELAARVEALIRRITKGNAKANFDQEESVGEFLLDYNKKTVLKNGSEISLTPTEFQIMKHLIQNRGRTVDRNEILDSVWGVDYEGQLKIVEVNIRRLRQKIESDPSSPEYLKTVRGHGYMWCCRNDI